MISSKQGTQLVRFFFTLAWVAGFIPALSQQQTADVRSSVSDGKAPVARVAVDLLRAMDSSKARSGITDDSGRVLFKSVPAGTYLLRTDALGFAKAYSMKFIVGSIPVVEVSPIHLTAKSAALSDVAVTSKKPFIEQLPGKTVLNIESSVLASGGSAFDVLQRAPGVYIDQNDVLSLKGKAGVIIMIDGKPSQISGSDLANLLRGMAANTIDRIEIISNPDAKYDASGSAGIINIRMKKDTRIGANGTYTAMLGQGVYPKWSQGLSFNYRNKKINLFGNYSYSYRKNFANPRLEREFLHGDTLKSAYSQNIYQVASYHTHTLRVGADYSASARTVVGVVLTGLENDFDPHGTDNSYVRDSSGAIVSSFSTLNTSTDRWHNTGTNLNLRHKLDTSGAELTADIDYVRYWHSSEQNYVNNYYFLNGSMSRPTYILFGDLPGSLDIYSAKSDLVKPFGKGAKLEAGWKSSLVVSDNDIKFYDRSGSSPIPDTSKSNHFIYRENINAAYVNMSGHLGKLEVQAGLRAEQTVTSGKQTATGQHIDSNYVQLFPSAALTWSPSKNHDLGFTVSRRIDRPTYRQLNPFKFYLDPSTYVEGYPGLYPQTTYNFQLDYTFRKSLIVSLAYSDTHNNITEVLIPSEADQKVTVQTNRNLPRVRYYSATITYNGKINSWFTTATNFVGYYGYYEGDLGNTPLSNGSPAFNINSTNTFTLGKNWTAEASLVYRSAEVYGYYHLNSIWQAGAGVQKSILKKRGTLKLSVADALFSFVVNGSTSFKDYYESFVTRKETRLLSLSLTYRFGRSSVAPSKRRTSGAEDEKSRAGNG